MTNALSGQLKGAVINVTASAGVSVSKSIYKYIYGGCGTTEDGTTKRDFSVKDNGDGTWLIRLHATSTSGSKGIAYFVYGS